MNESHRETGIDGQDLRSRIASVADAYLASSCDASSDMAYGWMTADLLADVELVGFLRWRTRRVSGSVEQFRATLPGKTALAVIPTVQRPTATTWIEESDLGELAKAADYLEVPFYEPTAARAIADAWDTLRRTGGDGTKIRAILRPGPPDLDGGRQTAEAVRGIAELGIRDFAFYNWGFLRKHDFVRIGPALKSIPLAGIRRR